MVVSFLPNLTRHFFGSQCPSGISRQLSESRRDLTKVATRSGRFSVVEPFTQNNGAPGGARAKAARKAGCSLGGGGDNALRTCAPTTDDCGSCIDNK